MMLLATSDDEFSLYHLSNLLKDIGVSGLNSFTDAKVFLSQLIIPIIARAYLKSDINNGLKVNNPSLEGYTEEMFNGCCRALLNYKDTTKAEERIAVFISILLQTFQPHAGMLKLILDMTTAFARGHFLDIKTINKRIDDDTPT